MAVLEFSHLNNENLIIKLLDYAQNQKLFIKIINIYCDKFYLILITQKSN